jgi:hypothetical protein
MANGKIELRTIIGLLIIKEEIETYKLCVSIKPNKGLNSSLNFKKKNGEADSRESGGITNSKKEL